MLFKETLFSFGMRVTGEVLENFVEASPFTTKEDLA